MRGLFSLALSVYRGYAGDGERHILRIFLVAAISIVIAFGPRSLNKDVISTMAVIVSVLAGFSFTALFSNHSHSVSDLPPAVSESDRQDIRNISILFNNFRDRARYFLLISLICLITSFFVSVPFDINEFINFFNSNNIGNINSIFSCLWKFLCFFARFICLFLFFEILYTFYRLSQTIFSILDTRREYLDGKK